VCLSFQATGEAEIGRIEVPGQPRGKKLMRSYLNRKKLGMVVCTCHPSYMESIK
jgi:hypothetical protein